MNPLAIRIAADLKAFKANMAEMRTQLETNASAMKRMASAFDGNKVIGDANAMVKAIHDIGGASKLTDSEMRRVNGTVTEALAKYKALGRDAPPELVALQNATAKVNTETEKMPSFMDKVNTRATAMGAAIGTFVGNIAFQAVSKLGAEIGVFASRGLQLQQVESSFQRLAKGANQSSSELLSGMKAASRGLISEYDLMLAANKALLLGLPVTSKSMDEMTRAAVVLGKAMGLTATDSIDKMTTALGRSSALRLDDLGLTVKQGEANEEYAKKMKIVGRELDEGEKKLAFYEKAMEAARAKTKELDNETTTLSETMVRVWTWVGDNVTRIVSDANTGFGDLVVMLQNSNAMWKAWKEGGSDAVLRLTGELGRFKNAIFELTDAQKKEVDQLLKNGIPAHQIYDKSLGQNEASVMAYINSLKKAPPAIVELTDEQKRAIKEAEKFAEAVEKQKDKINGVIKPSKEWAAAIKQLGMELQTLPKGPGTAVGWFDSLPDLSGKIRVFNQSLADAKVTVKSFFDTLRVGNDDMKNVFMSKENMQFLPTKAMIDLATGELIPAMANSGKRSADSFRESLADSLGNLGNIIVGAIQGGGDVLGSIFASLGNSLGSIFGKSLEKSIGGMLGSLLGGLGGPIGALLGGLAGKVGNFLGGLFGKNQGRDDAKAFAAAFGGFDALRQEMLKLGDEGDRLWIQLTQNTKGPAQVAATIKAIEEAFRKAEEAATKSGAAMEDAFKGPEGARGFPTRAQLQKAAKDAEEAYRYMAASGEYTADVLEKAWQQWQDAMIASGDETAKRMKDLAAEITSLQKAVEMETPEYDADGVRIYGVEELRNIERLAALEAEKAALVLANIEKEKHAVEEAAKAADLTADKEFEAAKLRAINLDEYLKKLFSGGYEIPITFRLPGGLPSGGGLPNNGSPFGNGAPLPSLPARASAAPTHITVVSLLDGREVARNQVKYIPKELDFIGARR